MIKLLCVYLPKWIMLKQTAHNIIQFLVFMLQMIVSSSHIKWFVLYDILIVIG